MQKMTKILVKRVSGSENDVGSVLSNQSVDAMAKIIRQSEEEPCVSESISSLEGDANSLVSYFNCNMNNLLKNFLVFLQDYFDISKS